VQRLINVSDKELIDDIIINNNQKAFEVLANRYQPLISRTCLGFVNSQYDAEDITQEVLIELFESLSSFRNESKISTWLYRISVNKSLNHIRKQKRDRMFRSIESFFVSSGDQNEPLEIIDKGGMAADKDIIQSENKRMIKTAINKLPESQRIAFLLSKYQDLSYKEIAEVMNVSISSVESLLFRAKSNLQKHLLVELKK
jgi:RNA polymerase sigma-70 factor (ECF subfamily)